MLYGPNYAVYSKEEIMNNGPKLVTESGNRKKKKVCLFHM